VLPQELLSKAAGALYGTNVAAASVATQSWATLITAYLDAVQRDECPDSLLSQCCTDYFEHSLHSGLTLMHMRLLPQW
jgi:hypothetical protein